MSPVHDQSYRRYQGPRRRQGHAWKVIVREGVRQALSRRLCQALLVFAWMPFLARCIQFYVVATQPQAEQLFAVDVRLFQSFVEFQGFCAFFVTVVVGSGLIALDRRAHALPVYLSKPLSRLEYIGGKFGVLASLLALVVIAPSLLLVVMQVLLSGSAAFLRGHLDLIPAVFLASSLRVLVYAGTMLALSSLSTSTRYVAVLYTGVIFFAEAVYRVLTFVTGSTAVAWVSPSGNVDVVTDAIFKQAPRYETPVIVSALLLVGILAVSASVLERRVRGVEVVA